VSLVATASLYVFALFCVVSGGPYFPKLGQKATVQKTNIRCPRPQFQMFLHRTQLEASKVLGFWNAYSLMLLSIFYNKTYLRSRCSVRVWINCLWQSKFDQIFFSQKERNFQRVWLLYCVTVDTQRDIAVTAKYKMLIWWVSCWGRSTKLLNVLNIIDVNKDLWFMCLAV